MINQVQSSHDIKWTELTLMLTGQLPKVLKNCACLLVQRICQKIMHFVNKHDL